MAVFGLTALAWITRGEPFGGWKAWLDLPYANDASVALLAVIVMFLVSDGKGGRLLNWERASTIPWGVLLLFAGGICLARGFVSSGLSSLLGDALADLESTHLCAHSAGLPDSHVYDRNNFEHRQYNPVDADSRCGSDFSLRRLCR